MRKLPVFIGLSLSAHTAMAQGVPQGTMPADIPIPVTFRGQLVWQGTYSGNAKVPSGNNRVVIGGFQLNVPSVRTVPINGTYIVTADFVGGSVSGKMQAGQPLGGENSFTGTVDGNTCHLTFPNGLRIDAYCSARFFRTNLDFSPRPGTRVAYQVESTVARFRNLALEEKQQQIAQNQARENAQKRAAAEAAAIAAMPVASKIYSEKLEKLVSQDSVGWGFNRYDLGSIRNVRVAYGSAKTGTMILRGEYTFNGGASGWVFAKLIGGEFDCIQFFDSVVGCRGLRDQHTRTDMQQMVFGTLSGGGGSSSGPNAREDYDQAFRNKQLRSSQCAGGAQFSGC